MSKQLLVVLGMPGSGKDTQIDKLLARQAAEVLRTGDMVRDRAKTDSEFAQAVEKGDLANDSVVNDMINTALKNSDQDLLISDGFPRDIAQAEWLDETLQGLNYEFMGALYLQISDHEAFKRLLERGRVDDDETTINHRVEVFHTQTDPVVEHYKSQGKLLQVNGQQSVEQVATEVQKVLGW